MRSKVCLVTGANSGIGKATALALATKGATVAMVCRDRGRGEAARAEIAETSGNESVELLVADLSSQGATRKLAEEFSRRHRRMANLFAEIARMTLAALIHKVRSNLHSLPGIMAAAALT